MPLSKYRVVPWKWADVSEERLRLEARRVSQAGKHHEAGCSCWLFHVGFLLDLILKPENRGDIPQTLGWLSPDNTALYLTGYNLHRAFLYSRLESICASTSECLLERLFIFHATLNTCLQPFYWQRLSLSSYTFQLLHLCYASHVSHIFACFYFCPVAYLQAKMLKF
jgi:hypothetical protein